MNKNTAHTKQKYISQPKLLKTIAPIVGGIFYTLAFSPFDYAPLAIIALVFFIFALENANKSQATIRAFLIALSSFTTGVYWVYIPIAVYGGANLITASSLSALLIIYLASLFALLGYTFAKLFPSSSKLKWLLGLPTLWVLFEILRGTLFTGFPWAFVGISQIDMPIAGFAPILGVYGVSLISVFSAGLIWLILTNHTFWKILFFCVLCTTWAVGYFLLQFNWTTQSQETVSVALLQGNIPVSTKWDPEQALNNLSLYNDLTEANWGSQLIVWPEGVLPFPIPDSMEYVNSVAEVARLSDSTVMLSAPIRMGQKKQHQYYNGIVTAGVGTGSYFKHHLLPFGDYVPLAKYLRGLISFFDLPMSSYRKGPKKQPPIVINDHLRLAPLICFEIAFSDLARHVARHSNMIVNVSEDAWFGHSIGPYQHFQLARMRALETGKPVIRVTNTGLTAVISQKGKILSELPPYEIGVLNAEVSPTSGTTPWTHLGKLNISILLILVLALSVRLNLAFRN